VSSIMQRLRDTLGKKRKLGQEEPRRLVDRGGDRGRGNVHRKLTHSLGAEGPERVGYFYDLDPHRWRIESRRDRVVSEVRVRHDALVEDDVLEKGIAEALRRASD